MNFSISEIKKVLELFEKSKTLRWMYYMPIGALLAFALIWQMADILVAIDKLLR